MRYVAAYLLAVLGQKADPSAADIEKILSSVGIEMDKEKVQKVVSELKGKVLEDILAEGGWSFQNYNYCQLVEGLKHSKLNMMNNHTIFRLINCDDCY